MFFWKKGIHFAKIQWHKGDHRRAQKRLLQRQLSNQLSLLWKLLSAAWFDYLWWVKLCMEISLRKYGRRFAPSRLAFYWIHFLFQFSNPFFYLYKWKIRLFLWTVDNPIINQFIIRFPKSLIWHVLKNKSRFSAVKIYDFWFRNFIIYETYNYRRSSEPRRTPLWEWPTGKFIKINLFRFWILYFFKILRKTESSLLLTINRVALC